MIFQITKWNKCFSLPTGIVSCYSDEHVRSVWISAGDAGHRTAGPGRRGPSDRLDAAPTQLRAHHVGAGGAQHQAGRRRPDDHVSQNKSLFSTGASLASQLCAFGSMRRCLLCTWRPRRPILINRVLCVRSAQPISRLLFWRGAPAAAALFTDRDVHTWFPKTIIYQSRLTAAGAAINLRFVVLGHFTRINTQT